jgi:hypothetical protein
VTNVRLTDTLTESLTPNRSGRWEHGPMTTRTQQTNPRRWLLFFLAALVVVLTILGLAATASAATNGVAETRVRASAPVVDVLVEPPERITAGQQLGKAVAQRQIVVATGVAAKTATEGGEDLTRLYRAVDPAELKDIAGTGVYRSAPGGTEGKYFFPTKGQAENFSNMMGKTGTGPYCITSGCIPTSVLRGIETIHAAGEGTAYFIPQDLLPYFRDIVIHGQ